MATVKAQSPVQHPLAPIPQALAHLRTSLVAGVVLPATLATAPAWGDCVETGAGTGVFNCEGPTITTAPTPPPGGALSVDLAGPTDIVQVSGNGIDIANGPADTGITVTHSGNISVTSTDGAGIAIDNSGTGDTSVTTGTAAAGSGIAIQGSGAAIELSNANSGTIGITTAMPLLGGESAIYVLGSSGTNAITVTVNEDIATDSTAYGDAGNLANNDSIGVRNAAGVADGPITIEVNADITTGAGGNASVYAATSAAALNVTTATGTTILNNNFLGSAVDVRQASGVGLPNSGPGDINLTLNGVISGAPVRALHAQPGGDINATLNGPIYHGLTATHLSPAGDITVTAASKMGGGQQCIRTQQRNNYPPSTTAVKNTDITVTSSASFQCGSGIRASHRTGGALTVDQAGTIEAYNGVGIEAIGFGVGTTIDITHSGDIEATGSGMFVSGGYYYPGYDFYGNQHYVGDVTITTAPGSSVRTIAASGIRASNYYGSGSTTINVSGEVVGVLRASIDTYSSSGTLTEINLNAGALVTTDNGSSTTPGIGSGIAIRNNGGESVTVVNSGAVVDRDITLGDGSDLLSFAGGDPGPVTLFDGGDDALVGDTWVDVLSFSDVSASIDGSTVVNWETITLDSGANIAFANGALTAGENGLQLINGGTLDARAGLALTGDLLNPSGVVNMADGDTDDSVTVSGDYEGGGSLVADVDFGADSADALVIAGDVLGGAVTTLQVNEASAGPASGNDIPLVSVTGAAVDGAFALAGPGYVDSGSFRYQLLRDPSSGEWLLRAGPRPPDPDPVKIPTMGLAATGLLSAMMALLGATRLRQRRKTAR